MTLNRRTFVKLGALSSMAIGAHSKTAFPGQDAPVRPMASQARPITSDEYLQRQENARRFMHGAGIEAIFLTGGTSLQYFTGAQWGLSERLFAMVLPAKGDLAWVAPAFEKGRALEQIKFGTDVRTWQEDESPYLVVVSILKDRGVTSGKIGIEETVKFAFSDGISKAAPALKLVSADPVTSNCRRIKSAHEIDLMRLANQITLKAFEIAVKTLKQGMTQNELAGSIAQAHQQMGARGGALVLFAADSALPHGTINPHSLREGDIVLMDGGCSVENYASDITRTTVFGKPTDKQLKVFDIVKRAQGAALKTARPGVACEDVDAAARKVVTDGGYGPDYKYFTHRVGHGIGMDGHEWTYLVRGNKTKLEAGMSFSDEPGIYIPGEFGIRCEDIMVIRENGAELLTGQAPSLEHPFG